MRSQTHPESFPGQRGLDAEGTVRDSGVNWTILRPWELASNTLAWIPELRQTGVVHSPKRGVPSPAVDPTDVADVAAAALSSDDHFGEIYALTGPERLTPEDKIAAISAAVGTSFRFDVVDDPGWRQRIFDESPDPAAAELAIPGICGLDSTTITDTTQRLLHQPARTFADWAQANAAAFS